MSVEPIAPLLEPVRKTISVPLEPARAFALFTARIGEWWPLATHSVGGADTTGCGFEMRAGGEVYELLRDGTRAVWGTVLAWEPPGRVVFSWHPGRAADTAQTVEVRFTGIATGTRVELEHRDWQRLGAAAAATRGNYDRGWEPVLACFVVAGGTHPPHHA